MLKSREFELETAEPADAATGDGDGDDDASCARIVRSSWAAKF